MIFDVSDNNLECTGYTGEYLRAILTNGDTEATCILCDIPSLDTHVYMVVQQCQC